VLLNLDETITKEFAMSCQDHLYCHGKSPQEISRRWFFQQCGVGLGASRSARCSAKTAGRRRARRAARAQAAALRAKAKRVIFLFMAGAPSHLELFDYKPQLAKFDGTLPPAELIKDYRAAFISPNSRS
jgi:hypothetical protein